MLLVLIQLVLDAIDQGLPTRFDDVRRHAHCSPPVMLTPGLNQYPHRGSGPRVAPQDPNLIVEQFHLLQLGIELGERFAQGTVERVDWTVPLSCRVLHCAIRSLDHDCRLRQWGLIFLALLVDHAKADQAEMLDLRSEEHTSELQSLAYLVCRLL